MSYGESGDAATLVYVVRKNSVRYGARATRLPDLSFRLLRLLAEREPGAVAFEEIERAVWGAQVTRETMKQRAKLLRDALSGLGVPEDAVAAVRSVGYRLTIPARAQLDQPSSSVFARKRSRWALTAMLACVVGAAVLFGAPWERESGDFQLAIVPAPIGAAAGELQMALGRDLATQLASVEDIDVLVTEQNSLRSDLLLTYAIVQRPAGQHLSMQLIDQHSGLLVWGRDYPFDGNDYQRTLSHIAANVHANAQLLGLVLGRGRLTAQPQAAQREYMAVLGLARGGREADLVVARERLDALITERPGFALARSLRARVMADLVLDSGYPHDLALVAVAEAQALVADHPDVASFRYTLARAEWAAGNKDAALDHLNAAARSMPFLQRDIQELEREIADARGSVQ